MPQAQSAMPNPLILFGPLLLIWYLLLIRPESRRRKTHEEMLKNLKKNDEVVTVGGIFGTVVNVKPEAITVRIDDNVRIDVERSAIARLAKAPTTDATPSLASTAR